MKFNWTDEESIYRGLIAICMINEHKTKCTKHEIYWSRQIKESSQIFGRISEYCSLSIEAFLPKDWKC